MNQEKFQQALAAHVRGLTDAVIAGTRAMIEGKDENPHKRHTDPNPTLWDAWQLGYDAADYFLETLDD